MQEIQLDLSRTQVNKLKKGGAVQLKASQMGCGMPLMVSAAISKRVARSMKSGKGMRLSLTDEELQGSGIFEDIKEGFRKASKFYQKNLKPVVGPLIKKGLQAGLKAGVAAASAAQPELAPGLVALEKAYGDKLVNVVGKQTGAYGLKKKAPLSEERKEQLREQLKRAREVKAAKQGGSFKAAGVKKVKQEKKVKKDSVVVENYAKNLRVDHPAQEPVILDSPGGLPGSGGKVIHVYHHHMDGSGFRPA